MDSLFSWSDTVPWCTSPWMSLLESYLLGILAQSQDIQETEQWKYMHRQHLQSLSQQPIDRHKYSKPKITNSGLPFLLNIADSELSWLDTGFWHFGTWMSLWENYFWALLVPLPRDSEQDNGKTCKAQLTVSQSQEQWAGVDIPRLMSKTGGLPFLQNIAGSTISWSDTVPLCSSPW